MRTCFFLSNTVVRTRQQLTVHEIGAAATARGCGCPKGSGSYGVSNATVMLRFRELEDEAIKAELTRFKGVGAKTVACVLMFCLERPEFPVDVHVSRVADACCDGVPCDGCAMPLLRNDANHCCRADRLKCSHTALQRSIHA